MFFKAAQCIYRSGLSVLDIEFTFIRLFCSFKMSYCIAQWNYFHLPCPKNCIALRLWGPETFWSRNFTILKLIKWSLLFRAYYSNSDNSENQEPIEHEKYRSFKYYWQRKPIYNNSIHICLPLSYIFSIIYIYTWLIFQYLLLFLITLNPKGEEEVDRSLVFGTLYTVLGYRGTNSTRIWYICNWQFCTGILTFSRPQL